MIEVIDKTLNCEVKRNIPISHKFQDGSMKDWNLYLYITFVPGQSSRMPQSNNPLSLLAKNMAPSGCQGERSLASSVAQSCKRNISFVYATMDFAWRWSYIREGLLPTGQPCLVCRPQVTKQGLTTLLTLVNSAGSHILFFCVLHQ